MSVTRFTQYNVVAFVDKDDITRTSVVANGIRFPIISEMAFEKRCMEDRRVCAVIAIGKPGPRFSVAQRFEIFFVCFQISFILV